MQPFCELCIYLLLTGIKMGSTGIKAGHPSANLPRKGIGSHKFCIYSLLAGLPRNAKDRHSTGEACQQPGKGWGWEGGGAPRFFLHQGQQLRWRCAITRRLDPARLWRLLPEQISGEQSPWVQGIIQMVRPLQSHKQYSHPRAQKQFVVLYLWPSTFSWLLSQPLPFWQPCALL